MDCFVKPFFKLLICVLWLIVIVGVVYALIIAVGVLVGVVGQEAQGVIMLLVEVSGYDVLSIGCHVLLCSWDYHGIIF